MSRLLALQEVLLEIYKRIESAEMWNRPTVELEDFADWLRKEIATLLKVEE